MLQWLRYDCLFLHDVLSYSPMVFVCIHGSNFWGMGSYGWGGLDLVTNFRSTQTCELVPVFRMQIVIVAHCWQLTASGPLPKLVWCPRLMLLLPRNFGLRAACVRADGSLQLIPTE